MDKRINFAFVFLFSVISISNGWNEPYFPDGTSPVVITPAPERFVAGMPGQVVVYSCSGVPLPGRHISFMAWYQRRDNLDIELAHFDGGTDLKLNKVLTAADVSTDIFCKVIYSRSYAEDLVVYSEYITLMSSATAETDVAPARSLGLKVPTMTIMPNQSDVVYFTVGDEVEFKCRVENMWYRYYLRALHVKGNSEYQKSSTNLNDNGIAEVTFTIETTLSDDNTKVYCRTWYYNGNGNDIIIRSAEITLRIRSDSAPDNHGLETERVDERKNQICTETVRDQLKSEINSFGPGNTDIADHSFLTTLLPHLNKIPEDRKLSAKSEILGVLQKYQSFQSEQATESLFPNDAYY